MKRDNLAFLVGGLAFGALVGYFVSDLAGARSRGAAAPGPPAAAVQPAAGAPAPAQDATDPALMQEIETLKRVLEQDPKNAAALVRLANIFHDAGMWTQAIAHYERALAVSPANADVLTDLGICYRGSRQFDRALDAFDRAQKADPNHWKSLFNIAIVAGFDLGRFDVAERAIGRIEQINPGAPNLQRIKDDLARVRASKEGPS